MTKNVARGRFITFEGGEGSGKTTQIKDLASALRTAGHEVIETREPGGSATGERIRAILLDPAVSIDPITQALLFSASRRDHVETLIKPALQRGAWVLCDRFADSTRAYQGAAGDVPPDLVDTLVTTAVGETVPDLTIILDMPVAESLRRAAARRGRTGESADAFEAATIGFHERVREGYLATAKREPERCVVIDGDRTVPAIATELLALVRKRFTGGWTG